MKFPVSNVDASYVDKVGASCSNFDFPVEADEVVFTVFGNGSNKVQGISPHVTVYQPGGPCLDYDRDYWYYDGRLWEYEDGYRTCSGIQLQQMRDQNVGGILQMYFFKSILLQDPERIKCLIKALI